MTIAYPATFEEIRPWSRDNGIDSNEGRVRFAQYAILRGIASSRTLSALLVFKGGNALDFVWQPNRSTRDLDFSADMAIVGDTWDPAEVGALLKDALGRGLTVATAQLGVVFAIHSVTKEPPAPESTFVTYELRIGYALPDQRPLLGRMAQGLPSAQVIPVEVSLNEPICADQATDIRATNTLRVSTLEDIVAEKLRALLQQPLRNRGRRQDLLDIAVILAENPHLDHARVAVFLERKARARGVPVSRAAFRETEIARRACQDYEALRETTRKAFIPFNQARQALLNFTGTLDIPEE